MELRAFKIILVGPQSAGKSSLIYRITESLFNQNYTATIGIDFRTHEVTVAEKSYSLHLWDTAGQEKFRALTSTYYKGSQGCLCVYDISSKESL